MDELEKARELVKRLPPKAKARLLFGDGFWKTAAYKKEDVPSVVMHDGPLGLRIPGKNGTYGLPAVCFPSPACLASSFSEKLMFRVGEMMGMEALFHNTDLLLAPGVNIKRNPLCGRNFEYYSEDPLLSGKLGSALIRGIQYTGAGATLKHFMGNNQEYRRFTYSAEIGERALHEIYLQPFEIALREGHPWALMASYNKVNGVQMASNDLLLKDLVKGAWGFDGCIMSDWGGSAEPVTDHERGLDLEMPMATKKRTVEILKAVEEGQLSQEDVDEAAARVLTMAIRKNERKEASKAWNAGMGRMVARQAAGASIVLAKNDRDFLPFKDDRGLSVIGAAAEVSHIQGSGSSYVTPIKPVSFLDVVHLKSEHGISYARGYAYGDKHLDSQKLKDEAVELAKKSKKVLLFLALPLLAESEGYDREDMELPKEQRELFDAVYEVNQNICLVVIAGSPVELPFADRARAILLPYLPGEAGMEALYDILMGRINPSGRLAETWPLSYEDVPSSKFYPGSLDRSLYKESIYVGYRFYETANEPVRFPFGHGLSYTKFKYGKIRLSEKSIEPDGKATLEIDVTNIGKVVGREVVLLFVSKKANSHARPKRELKGFVSLSLKPGETKTARFELSYRDFCFYCASLGKWASEGGVFNLEIMKNASKSLVSSSIKVIASDKVPAEPASAKPYLTFVKNGFLDVSDQEFAAYAGKIYEKEGKPNGFDENSTFQDISRTWIGKIIKAVIHSIMTDKDEKKNHQESGFYLMAMAQPLRSASTMGISKKMVKSIVAWANGHFFEGFKNLLRRH